MKRPRVICELSAYLAILLRWGLRSGEERDPGVIQLLGPEEMEREGPAPAFFLHLYHLAPDRRAARAAAIVEAADERQDGVRVEMRRPPLWVTCRYLTGVRGRGPEEEQEMLSAVLRTLHDHPLLGPEALPSLRQVGRERPTQEVSGLSFRDGGPPPRGAAAGERYPLELVEEREGWRLAGLLRPRPLVAFQVKVPVPSARSEPLERVLERELRLGELR